ncbi:hypothetical protein DEO72_LG1g2338 [Vigna unguiculata]|uniref:Uncharacterized protein n=1 Tax=Vigna unguiculata TaxID=3917 RepID=A0A4D6KMF0_VIGUN|nr:hypothetical protein DEO72_LG1g2338 [Vigna unguiculata]
MCWSWLSEFDDVAPMNKKHNLEEIPEESELGIDGDATPELQEACIGLEKELEVLRMGMDVGICALCLGFCYALSPSAKLFPRLTSSFFRLNHLL